MKKRKAKYNQVNFFLISKMILTFSSVLIFLVWLMFMTNNFYPKDENSIVNKIMNINIQILIWPIALIILFVFIMPIWVTNNRFILATFFLLTFALTIISYLFLLALNPNLYYWLWFIAHFIMLCTIIAIFFIFLIDLDHIKVINKFKLNKSKKKNYQLEVN